MREALPARTSFSYAILRSIESGLASFNTAELLFVNTDIWRPWDHCGAQIPMRIFKGNYPTILPLQIAFVSDFKTCSLPFSW
ncbi:unnamed protein product [Haemonchus placei]|uniref:Uncharacterized protein n=1 Tax=Haemonchus placei TaxID=6290 RepID=A0A0N4WZ79_HAEPC|nr:unnamed protein product [Haemonchus placei]